MPSSTAPPRLHFISASPVKGLAVAERRVRSPRATIICVHGALDRGGSFSRLARRLEDFDVVAYDRRGYQGSRDLGPVDLDHHVEDLLALTVREDPTQPVVLFGHSFGGVVTFRAATENPLRITIVINYESPAPWILPRHDARPPLSKDTPREVERFFRRVVSDHAWERLSDAQRESRRLDGPALLSDLATIRREGAPFDLADLRVPTTYVYGTGAAAASYYRALGAALTRVNPLITPVEIPEAFHSAHLGHPRSLAELIRERFAACVSQ